jgi:hypothetical protein
MVFLTPYLVQKHHPHACSTWSISWPSNFVATNETKKWTNEMNLLRRDTWQRYGADMLRNRRSMSERKFHTYFGIHSVTAVWLWAFLLPRWPHGKTPLLPPHLLWTLWFLRKYPTEDNLLEVTRTSGVVRQVVWGYVAIIAPLLPFVSRL